MKEFIHQTGLNIKRKDAFNLVQEAMFSNICQRILPMLKSYGVIADVIGDGINSSTYLKVEKISASQIKVNAGYAIIEGDELDTHTFIVLEEDITITISDKITAHTGTAYVYIEGLTEMEGTSFENYMPASIKGTDQIFLLSVDSSLVTITEALDPTKVLLAKLSLNNSLLSFIQTPNFPINEISTRPYIDSDDTTLTITPSSLGAGVPDTWTLLADNEQIEYSGGLIDHVLTLDTRGSNDTIGTIHYNIDTITISPIIDMRQTNAAKLSSSESSVTQNLLRGIINYDDGKGDRFIKALRVPDIPNAPVISADEFALIWLNKQTTGGNLNDAARDKVNIAKGLATRVENITSNIAYKKEELAGASAEDTPAINASISSLQQDMIEAKVELTAASAGLKDYVSSYTSTKKYIVACTIEQPTLIDDEQIVMYEASINYLPVNASAIDKMTGIAKQTFSPLLMPDGISSYGDNIYTYDIQPEDIYRTIQVSISPNEKILIKVRAITENNMYSAWSNQVEYVFDEYSTSDAALALDLDAIVNGYNPYENGVITEETIVLLKQMKSDFMSGIIQIQSYTNTVSTMNSTIDSMQQLIDSLTNRISVLEGKATGTEAILTGLQSQISGSTAT